MRQWAGLALAVGCCSVLAGAVRVVYDARPPLAHTGGFGEQTCRACHFDSPETLPVGVSLGGVPAAYRPGAVYRLAVAITDTAARVGGFQLAARIAAGPHAGAQAGSLCAVDRRVAVERDTVSGVEYASHEGAAPADSLQWTFAWRAPAVDVGTVVFHLTANAANDDDSVFGDRIHRASAESRPESAAPARASSPSMRGCAP